MLPPPNSCSCLFDLLHFFAPSFLFFDVFSRLALSCSLLCMFLNFRAGFSVLEPFWARLGSKGISWPCGFTPTSQNDKRNNVQKIKYLVFFVFFLDMFEHCFTLLSHLFFLSTPTDANATDLDYTTKLWYIIWVFNYRYTMNGRSFIYLYLQNRSVSANSAGAGELAL